MKRIPCATYRLQFNREFTLRQANEIAEYLGELGISDVYASPLFEAGPQSMHGYDVCCFDRINGAIGSRDDLEQLAGTLKARGLGLLLDMVPNHMGAAPGNAWWMDVLEHGRESAYAGFFDIEWAPENPALRDKVLLPVLEDHYGKVLESGKLRLVFKDRTFWIAYYDREFPVDPATLPADAAQDAENILKTFNGRPGSAYSFERLDDLIRAQHYCLAAWRSGPEEINYRRFFDITELVALKMELPEVFRAAHHFLFGLVYSEKITGLRIDHPDGLWNPREYFERLQRETGPVYVVAEKILSGNEALPPNWPVDGTTGYEFLNRVNGLFVDASNAGAFDALYHGFTGCEESFAEVARRSKKEILWRSFRGEFRALAAALRRVAARARHGWDFTLSQWHGALEGILSALPVYRTYVTEASEEISKPDRAVIREAAATARILAGSVRAPGANAADDTGAIDFIERLLLLELDGELDEEGQKAARRFAMKFQQLSGPLAAKGIEDTAFYRFNRLVSLNEVGGDPGRFGITAGQFHEANRATAAHWPHTLLAGSTHDTKRGEDARARINVLSEMPDEWRDAIARWSRCNAKVMIGDSPAPDANDEYLLYQTLVGAWPVPAVAKGEELNQFRERVTGCLLKSAKEAKVNTSWTEPNAPYEQALEHFVERVLDPSNQPFMEDFLRFQHRAAFFGQFNSLSQTLLRIASPGAPDFYQGSELLDLNLVDPDNRRPVDYGLRRRRLRELKERWERAGSNKSPCLSEMLACEDPGEAKMFLIWRALQFRRQHRDLFERGEYVPLSAAGKKAEHICAFARIHEGAAAIVAVPRLVFGLTRGIEWPPIGEDVWADTILMLPVTFAQAFQNVLTTETIAVMEADGRPALRMSEALKRFPVALLNAA